jgi:hypothetical protein
LIELQHRCHLHGPLRGRWVEVGVHPDPNRPARIIRVERLLDFLQRRDAESSDPGRESDSA